MNDELHDPRLEALAQRLGARAAERLDVERTAEAVVRRLREQPRATRRLPRVPRVPAWLSLAAGLVLLVGGGVVWRAARPGRIPPATALAPPGLDLNALSADQLREVLQAVDQPLDVDPGAAADAGLEDLTPRELRALLSTLEG